MDVLQKQQSSFSSDSIQRGLALVLNADFAETPAGRREYEQGINSIRTSVMETLRHQIVLKMFETKTRHSIGDVRFARSQRMTDVLKMNRDRYAMLNKGSKGIRSLVSKITAHGSENEINFDLFALPTGAFSMLSETHDRDLTYSESGPIAIANIRRGHENVTGYLGVKYRELPAFKRTDSSINYNPSKRERQHGSYYILKNFCSDPEKYTSELHNAIVILDGKKDRMVPIKAIDLFEKSGRFDKNGNLDRTKHLQMINNFNTLQAEMGTTQPLEDVFIWKSDNKQFTAPYEYDSYFPCVFFGDIEEKHLSNAKIEEIARMIHEKRLPIPSSSEDGTPTVIAFDTSDQFKAVIKELSDKDDSGGGPDSGEGSGGAKKNKRMQSSIAKLNMLTAPDATVIASLKKILKQPNDVFHASLDAYVSTLNIPNTGPKIQIVSTVGSASFERVDVNKRHINDNDKKVSNDYENRLESMKNSGYFEEIKFFMGKMINLDNIKLFYKNNIDIGLAFILDRPFQTYSMSSGFMVQGGPEFARTRVGHDEFGWNKDAGTKKLTGYFTFHMAIDLLREDWIVHVQDIMCNSYLHGESVGFVNGPNFWRNRETENKDKDIIVRLCAASELDSMDVVHDIGGTWDMTLRQEVGIDDKEITVPSAYFYNHLYKLHEINRKTRTYKNLFAYDGRFNTVCFQGHQRMYNSNTCAWDHVINSQDNMGMQCRDGIVNERCSETSFNGIRDLPIMSSTV